MMSSSNNTWSRLPDLNRKVFKGGQMLTEKEIYSEYSTGIREQIENTIRYKDGKRVIGRNRLEGAPQ